MPRIKAVVEIGPHPGSPYANWGVYEIGPDAFEDQGVFESDFSEVRDVLEDVDVGDSPHGPFSEQIQNFMLEAAAKLDAKAERENSGSGEVRKDFVLPYDQAHREFRDAGEGVPEISIDPRDLNVSVKVFTVEEDD